MPPTLEPEGAALAAVELLLDEQALRPAMDSAAVAAIAANLIELRMWNPSVGGELRASFSTGDPMLRLMNTPIDQ